jgi:vancomycin resistance protein VanJ
MTSPINPQKGGIEQNTRYSRSGHTRCIWCIRAASGSYLILLLALWLILYEGNERWWPATMILFGPRWLFSLPLLILVPLAAWFERRQLILLFIAAVILFVPVMRVCVPFQRIASTKPMIRVLTCNVGGSGLDIEKLRRLIQRSAADIIALQECPKETAESILPDWTILQDQRLTIASRYPVKPGKSHQTTHPPLRWPRASVLQGFIHTPEGELAVCSLHLPSPRYGLSSLLDRRRILNLSRLKVLQEEQELRGTTAQEIESLIRTDSVPMIVAGDSAWYRQYWSDYFNAFSLAGFGYGFTEKVAIRNFEYKIRIDHILTRGSLTSYRCWVGPDVGSDHLPLIADILMEKPK